MFSTTKIVKPNSMIAGRVNNIVTKLTELSLLKSQRQIKVHSI